MLFIIQLSEMHKGFDAMNIKIGELTEKLVDTMSELEQTKSEVDKTTNAEYNHKTE